MVDDPGSNILTAVMPRIAVNIENEIKNKNDMAVTF